MAWFKEEFGVEEGKSFAAVHGTFAVREYDQERDDDANLKGSWSGDYDFLAERVPSAAPPLVLECMTSQKAFYVGPFEVPSVAELRQRLQDMSASSTSSAGSGLRFSNIAGMAQSLHLDPENAGAVFQVASQLNLLEMVGPEVRPEDGITRYIFDRTQGPACAMSCPAGTVFRNYFSQGGKGQRGKSQLNTAADLEALLDNEGQKYWAVRNGYLMPTERGAMGRVAERLSNTEGLKDALRDALRVGVHWHTQTSRARRNAAAHNVAQIYCSACPVTYTKRTATSEEWAPLARTVLEGAYEATLLAAAMLALRRGERVKVYLTKLGGGAFGNRTLWICDALRRALHLYRGMPLDVMMVNFAHMPPASDNFMRLEREFRAQCKGEQ